MYYDSIEEAIEANPHCTHVLTTSENWGPLNSKNVVGKFRATHFVGGRHLCANDMRCHVQIGSTSWVVARNPLRYNQPPTNSSQPHVSTKQRLKR